VGFSPNSTHNTRSDFDARTHMTDTCEHTICDDRRRRRAPAASASCKSGRLETCTLSLIARVDSAAPSHSTCVRGASGGELARRGRQEGMAAGVGRSEGGRRAILTHLDRIANVGHAPGSPRGPGQLSWPNLRYARAEDSEVTRVFRAGLVGGGGWLGAPIPCRKRSLSAAHSTTMPCERPESAAAKRARRGAQLHLHENAPIKISKSRPRRPEDGWCSRFQPACTLE
jgi:hypothetical protein